eukprot:3742398-Alexandrium_andersonii.AAC.1
MTRLAQILRFRVRRRKRGFRVPEVANSPIRRLQSAIHQSRQSAQPFAIGGREASQFKRDHASREQATISLGSINIYLPGSNLRPFLGPRSSRFELMKRFSHLGINVGNTRCDRFDSLLGSIDI